MGEEVLWEAGTAALVECPAFGPWVRRIGPVPYIPPRGGHFEVLVRTIVYQQLAGKAAATIHGRVVEALNGRVVPEAVLDTTDDALRGAGLSRNKLAAIRDLSERVASGDVSLELDSMEDEEVIESLTRVWGIGRWTAEMFLMFQLHRPDVWPVADLGVRKGWAVVHGAEQPPTAQELGPLAEGYRPYRSAVAWYCYRVLDLEMEA